MNETAIQSAPMVATKLVIGCGYLGLRVARLWRDQGHRIVAVTRSGDRAETLAAEGLTPLIADVTRSESLAQLPPSETVFFGVGFDRSARLSQRDVYVDGLRNVLTALAANEQRDQEGAEDGVRRFIYISTTGVYGTSHGEAAENAAWVDESTACDPLTPGGAASSKPNNGSRRVLSRPARSCYAWPDSTVQAVCHGDDLVAGRPISMPPDGFLNLIHIDDAARAVLAAERLAVPPRTFNISDGRPTTRRTYLETMAQLLAARPPRFAPAESLAAEAASLESAAKATRGSASKKVSNRRMHAELQLALAFPSYREGLAAILKKP